MLLAAVQSELVLRSRRPLAARRAPSERAMARLAALVEDSEYAIIGSDLHGTTISFNRGAEAIFGYRAEEIVGQPVTLLMAPEMLCAHRRTMERLCAGEHAEPCETVGVRRDGSRFDVWVTVSPVTDAEGKLLEVATVARDITKRKRHEAELRRSNEDLERFAYAASHDLSEPLRVIAGFVELLAHRYSGELDEEADRFIEFILSGVERMQATIDDLLSYSRAGRVELALSEVDSGALVGEVLQALVAAIAERATCVEVGAALPRLRAEPTLLRQVFQNLIGNAVKFASGRDPRVSVSARRDGQAWRFDVRDNGPGIDPKHSERVFEMFQRLHGRDVPGTGIGLAIVRRIVERHGGRVWFEPAPGGGSIFSFTIPDDHGTRR